MLYYLKKYPISIALILVVIYLSFFKPPAVHIPRFPYWDKFVHFCMYAGVSGMLWIEFLRNHRHDHPVPFKHGWIGAVFIPIFFSGLIEILQETLTTYRGGDWLDFLANTTGVFTATAIAWFIIRPSIFQSSQ
ncbi:VanZ family protein [Parabacteroides sp. PF5-9]|uniref:VanZ family protein n=1 Tax=Parabacteroides sp. PF5-9 TaxID=1742404 RepID=UPI00247315B6|nr:VanZ family protein [Parabacteroides sp. PF5-9]MDH6358174.1 VanZ family protein [Parabacteroides sp. PF5-9]